jgi:hypothetical protein
MDDALFADKDLLVLKGTVRGKTLELEEETGLPDGLVVRVAIRMKREDALRLSCGAWADMTPEEEADLEETLSQLRGRPMNIPKIERPS